MLKRLDTKTIDLVIIKHLFNEKMFFTSDLVYVLDIFNKKIFQSDHDEHEKFCTIKFVSRTLLPAMLSDDNIVTGANPEQLARLGDVNYLNGGFVVIKYGKATNFYHIDEKNIDAINQCIVFCESL